MLESDPHRVLEGMAIAGVRRRCQLRATSTVAPSTRSPWRGCARRSARPRSTGILGPSVMDTQFSLRDRGPAGRRRVRVRRGDRADRVDRGGPRDAAAPPAVPGRVGPAGPPDADQQRRDLRQRRADHPQRRARGSPASAPRRARGPRCSPSPAASSTPAWSRCRWARRCATSCTSIGGGIVDGRPFKAVQTGGPAGGCIPAQFLDMPVDYESLDRRSARSWAPAG